MKHMKYIYRTILSVVVLLGSMLAIAQETPKEEDFFKIMKVATPEGIILEVGGLVSLPNGNLGVSTRRGDVFIVENPTSNRPYFRKFASGLHEILGLAYKDGAFYCAQRGELTKLVDTNLDGKADVYETIYSWPLSGHYHEYSFGPKIAPDGSFFVTANVAFGNQEWWRGESRVPWRGWAMRITEDGNMQPWATGMRSPAGLGFLNDELFYTDNQGDWMGSGALWQIAKGDFMGHPAGLTWTGLPNSPLKLSESEFNSKIDPRKVKSADGRYIKPENRVNEEYKTLFGMKKEFKELRLPAVWLPYGILGISTSEPITIPKGYFGPYEGQILVGDQGMSMLSRVFMEKVNGEYQGASFVFKTGFRSGVLRMAWDRDSSLFIGETNRGWGSAGEANEGLQRLVWNNKMPFEMKAVRAMPDGFEIEFTQAVDPKSAQDLASYSVESYIYKYQPVYGSPPVDVKTLNIKGVKLSADGMKARIVVDNLRKYYIHTIKLDGIREKENYYSLVHPTAYYTLNNIPDGPKLEASELSTKNTSRENSVKPTVAPQIPTYDDVKGMMANYTCLSCHNPDRKLVGPSFRDIAKRKYSAEKILQLIHNPQPENWPEYPTPMPPMPQVKKEDALKIAAYINSLK